ncbi:hypothetical protein AA904_15260 [Geobacillus stearothermophilus]|nr:hypothetical protein AA904_15260 [Geobacillus stearothermophilus]KMY57151.1 hypothetical protein AA905_15280 [Geobacillus stearothermophilus]
MNLEIQYKYEMPEDQRELNDQKALAIDLGLNNLATCVTSDGRSFIIDGRRLKSINQWFNKENARLQSIKDKQKIKGTTRKQALLAMNRNNKVNDYCKLSLYFGTKETFFCTFLQKALSPFLKECAKFFVNYFGRENPSVHRRGRRT